LGAFARVDDRVEADRNGAASGSKATTTKDGADQLTCPMTIGYNWPETPVLGHDSAMNPRGPAGFEAKIVSDSSMMNTDEQQ
jgi:hypothetical protein